MKNSEKGKDLLIYRCNVCGNVVVKLVDSGITPICCGRDMELMVPGSVDADEEKHIPVWMMDGCKVIVEIGSKPHPHTKEHYIQWIIVKTNKGFYAKELTPDDEPRACFKMCKEEMLETVYCYCNLHHLWKATKEEKQYECPMCGV